MTFKVGYIIGSISSVSINRRLAEALVSVAPDNLELVELPIKQLPFYNHDFDGDYPAESQQFKDDIEAVDAVLFITPEYNRSVPGVFKNALDTASRPWGTNSFAGKPAAIIGASIGAISAAVAQNHLRTILGFLDMVVMGQPEGYIQFNDTLLNDDNTVADESAKQFLTQYMQTFADHIERVQR